MFDLCLHFQSFTLMSDYVLIVCTHSMMYVAAMCCAHDFAPSTVNPCTNALAIVCTSHVWGFQYTSVCKTTHLWTPSCTLAKSLRFSPVNTEVCTSRHNDLYSKCAWNVALQVTDKRCAHFFLENRSQASCIQHCIILSLEGFARFCNQRQNIIQQEDICNGRLPAQCLLCL